MVSVISRTSRAVSHSPELSRILRLPAKGPEAYPPGLTEAMSEIYRRPGSGAMLRDIQARALYDLAASGGLLGPIRVGAGKTLISLLAPAVLAARRPLLLLPAKLRDKTRREAMVLSQTWQIPGHVRIESYETLGRVGAAQALDVYRPDLIVADECHKLKNPRAAVTKRVSRYMREHLGHVHFVALSGTITKRSLRDYSHILHWCLPHEDAPIPRGWAEIEDWSLALDERPGAGQVETIHPGALGLLADAFDVGPTEPRARAREGFSRRLRATVGVVVSSDISVGASLVIQAVPVTPPPVVETALATLRSDWVLPSEDAEPLTDALSLWRYVRQLAMGFYYVWDPPPPKAWMLARKVWAKECRAILSDNRRHLDSELQVAQAVDAGHYPHAAKWLEEWRQIRPTFKPTTVPVWISDFAIVAAHRWASDVRGAPRGIIWTEHQAFAEALAKTSHLAYFGAGGVDRTGRSIESVQGRETVIASVEANAEGRNLQAWARNLVVSPMPNGVRWEQLLGRTHRDGQTADEVTCDVMVSVPEHHQAMAQAMADGRYQAQITGQNQKLLYADMIGFDL